MSTLGLCLFVALAGAPSQPPPPPPPPSPTSSPSAPGSPPQRSQDPASAQQPEPTSAGSSATGASPPLTPEALLDATTPTVEDLQDAALRRATVDPRTSRRWLVRARAAAALPSLRGELDIRRDQAWQLDQEAGDADALSQDSGAGQIIRFRVGWELDRLIFDPNELRAARAAVDMAMAREQVLVRVTQLYFERIQLLLDRATLGPQGALAQELRIREIEAVLFGLSGLRVHTGGA